MEDIYEPSEEEIKEDKQQFKAACSALVSLKHITDSVDKISHEDLIKTFLKCFQYKKEIEIYEFNAMMIKAAKIMLSRYDQSRDFDILLMSLGLLEGYFYKNIPNLNDRRWVYICATKFYGNGKNIPYETKDKKIQHTYTERLRQNEEKKSSEKFIKTLFTKSVGDLIKGLTDDDINYDEEMAILPSPYYLSIGAIPDKLTANSQMSNNDNDNHKNSSDKDDILPDMTSEDVTNQDEIDENSQHNEEQYAQDEKGDNPSPNPFKRIKSILIVISIILAVGGGVVLAVSYITEKRENEKLLEQVASLNSNDKERDSVIATSIEVENKNIELDPGEWADLIVKATPPEVDILFDLNYTKEPNDIVTIDKNPDRDYARVTALVGWEEGMCDKVEITIQGGGTAEAKAYVFIKHPNQKEMIGAGKNAESD